jgi:predicted enzyme related to lactoylglutathione lyase
MPAIDTHAIGSFCWSELVTPDVDASLVFYGALFGWEPEEGDLGDASRYVRCNLNGRPVSAMVQMSEEELSFQIAPYWAAYTQVAQTEDILAKATELGGTQVEGPIQVPGAGTLGGIEGPDGARLCLWQPDGFSGCGWNREIGIAVWYELWTREPDASRDFYAGLLDWTAVQQDMGETTYTSFIKDGEGRAGLAEMTDAQADYPAQWMIYIAVANIDATLEAAQALDATVLMPPTELPSVGRMATLRDPQGGLFSVIQMFDLQR